MKIEKMVEELNLAVGGSLSITHYSNWDLSSYNEKSLFSLPEGPIKAESFKELVEKAYKVLKEKRGE